MRRVLVTDIPRTGPRTRRSWVSVIAHHPHCSLNHKRTDSESLPMTAAGASFTICFPAAFVTFPTVGMKALTARARSRVISAGAFHNLVFWYFLVIVASSGVVNLASYVTGYRNVSDLGKVVIDVDQV